MYYILEETFGEYIGWLERLFTYEEAVKEDSKRNYEAKYTLWEGEYGRNRDKIILEIAERLYQKKFESECKKDYSKILTLDNVMGPGYYKMKVKEILVELLAKLLAKDTNALPPPPSRVILPIWVDLVLVPELINIFIIQDKGISYQKAYKT
ncbi:hypothetical protein EV426DRAFT_579041 [Tirmania nivea]|nr:hypothetical protein EV426DRAFT_579041 [Tirmania nivea]